MTNQDVLEILRKIDNGYKPTEKEKTELSNIKKIDWKCIESIPESIGNLRSLEGLSLSFTQIGELPESIGNLTSL